MKFSLDKQEKYTVFRLQEDNLNSLIAPAIKAELVKLFEEDVPNFILDLSDVKFVDSSGLSAILTGHRLWEDGGSFVLTNVTASNVQRLIEISKLDDIFTIIPTLDEAIEYVFMEDIQRELSAEEEEEENK